MKNDYESNREETYKTIKKKIKSELNESKVYNEIAKVKAILARQINELKALWKTEFNARKKSDSEISMALTKYKDIFEQEIKNKYALDL